MKEKNSKGLPDLAGQLKSKGAFVSILHCCLSQIGQYFIHFFPNFIAFVTVNLIRE